MGHTEVQVKHISQKGWIRSRVTHKGGDLKGVFAKNDRVSR